MDHAMPRWDDASLSRALDALLQADRAAKETRLSSEEQLLRNVIGDVRHDGTGCGW
jgi:hypothetical protein